MQSRTNRILAAAVAACALFASSCILSAATPVSYSGGDYTQNFDTLPNSPGQSVAAFPAPGPNDVPNNVGGVIAGWSFARFVSGSTPPPATMDFRIDNGSTNVVGHVGSYGTTGSTDRAFGSAATTATTPNLGFQLVNNTGGALDQFTLTYTGEQWRRGTQTAPGVLAFSYSTDATDILTGTYTTAALLNFTSPNTAAAPNNAVALDGNAAANKRLITATIGGFIWNPGQVMTFRWNDNNETDADDWLAVDDLTFSARKGVRLTWNTANASGTWNTDTSNKPWLNETPAPSHFTQQDTVLLADTPGNIDIAVDAAGVNPLVMQVTHAANKYSLSGGAVSGPLVKTGAGTLVLKSVNSFTSTAISGGVVETEVDGALGQVNINLSNGATWRITTNNQTAAANNTVNITGSATIDTQTDLNMVHSINGANVIFTKTGPGLLWARHNFPLTGASEVHVDGGILRDSDDLTNFSDGIPDSVVLRIAAGATFDESYGNGEQFSALAGDGTYLGHHVANGAGHINFLNNTATTFTFNGIITAGTAGVVGTTPDEREILALRKNGIHTAVLTNPNSDFVGQVQINNGVLEIPHIANRGQNSPIGMGNIATAPVTAGADITLGTNGLTPDTAGTLRYSGPTAASDRSINVNAGSGIIEVTNPATSLTLSGPIAGGNIVPLQKTGPGTLILTNDTNNLGGGMDVVAGKLLVNNSTGSAMSGGLLSAKDTATLGGTGTVTSNVYIQTGGTLAPGESIGTLNAGSTTFDPGSKLLWELNTNTSAADLFNVDGSLDFLGQATIDLVDLGNPAAKSFTLIKYTGGVNNFANLIIGTTPNPQLTYALVDNQANHSIDLSVTGTAAQPQWNFDGDERWGVAGNWVGGVPNSPSAIANLLGKITAPRTITVDGAFQVQEIHFDNANKYTLAPSPTISSLTVGNGVSGLIQVAQGTHEIGAPLVLSGAVSKVGGGTLIISGNQSHSAGSSLAVGGGQVILRTNAGSSATAGAAASAPLSLSIGGSGSKITLAADQNLKGLSISTADAGIQTFDLNSPTTAGAFRAVHIYAADLSGAKTSLYNAIKNALTSAGDGIADSGLVSHPGAKIGIAQVPDAHGDQNIFIRPTRIGDLNLDGLVTISDFIDLASNFNKTNTTWQEGDLNYDGAVTISDFIDLASNFNGSYSGETFPISEADAKALSDFASAHGVSVPEPATLALMLFAAPIAFRRRTAGPRVR